MKKLRDLEMELDIHASKSELWDITFNQFSDVTKWHPLVDESHYIAGTEGEVGCVRQCDLNAKTKVKEQITNRRGTDSFDVDIIDGGLPMMDQMFATIEFVEKGDNLTTVKMKTKYNTSPSFMAPIMKPMMKKTFLKVLIGLKYHMETGGIVRKSNFSEINRMFKRLNKGQAFSPNKKVAIA